MDWTAGLQAYNKYLAVSMVINSLKFKKMEYKVNYL